MHKQHMPAAQLFFTDLQRQAAQVSLALRRRVQARPHERLPASPVVLDVFVDTTAVVEIKAHAVVVVAHDGSDILTPDEIDYFVGERAVADQVAQAVNGRSEEHTSETP